MMRAGASPRSASARKAPTAASALAPPPERTSTTLMGDCLLPLPLVVPPLHHPVGAALRGPLVAALLVRGFGSDRRHLDRHAVIVERHVGHVTGIGVAAI